MWDGTTSGNKDILEHKCEELCRNLPKCTGFNWAPIDGHCWALNGCENPTTNPYYRLYYMEGSLCSQSSWSYLELIFHPSVRELTNLFVEFTHFLDMEAGYKLHSGCVKGTECSEGSKCGTSSETACKECNFEQCKAIAGKSNSKGFAYSGEKRLCRLCDESQFQNIQNKQTNNVENWGLYVKYGNLYTYFSSIIVATFLFYLIVNVYHSKILFFIL